jgi:hypothetical protein
MSLRKSPTLTPARLEANHRNALKSTGPRTARGKAQSKMNSLRTGDRSARYKNFLLLMLMAPPCSVGRMAQGLLTREQAAHPFFAETVAMFYRAEGEVAVQCVLEPARLRSKRKIPFPKKLRTKPECD